MEPHMNVMAWPNVKKKCSSGWKSVFLSKWYLYSCLTAERKKARRRVDF